MKSFLISFLFFIGVCLSLNAQTKSQLNNKEAYSKDSLMFYRNLVLKPQSNSDLINAFVYFKNKSENSIKKKDTLTIIYDLRYVAIAQFELGLMHDSEETAVASLNYLDGMQSTSNAITENWVGISNHLGRVYTRLKDYNSALLYYQKAKELQQDSSRLNSIKNNIALVHYKQGNFPEALNEFLVVHSYNLENKNKTKIARSLCNIGMILSKLNAPDAYDSLAKSLQIRKSIGHTTGEIDNYLKLSEHFKNRNEYKKAIQNANQALNLARSKNKIEQEIEALTVLSQLNLNEDVNRYTFLKDSVYDVKLNAQNSYAAKKYALEKQIRIAKENELKIKVFELDNIKQKQLKLTYLFASILLLLLIIFVIYYLRSKHKKDKLLEVYQAESRMSKKVHDEVANDVFQLMTKLEKESETGEEVVDELHELYYRTRDIAQEYVVLNSDLSFEDQLMDLIENFRNSNSNIILKGLSTINWTSINETKQITIIKVIQELLINMKKHSRASLVLISFERINGVLTINYSDNGVGCNIKKGNGLQNTENRIQAINGTIIFESELNKGFKTKIIIK